MGALLHGGRRRGPGRDRRSSPSDGGRRPGGAAMIVVAGATGTLGPLLVPLLVARGEPVRVVTRDPERGRRFDGVEVVGADVCTPEGAREAVAGARVVVSAITGFASPAGVRAVDERGNRIARQCRRRRGRRAVHPRVGCAGRARPPDRAVSGQGGRRSGGARLRDRLDDRSPDCLHGDLARHRGRADDRVRQGVDLWPRPQPDQLRVGSRTSRARSSTRWPLRSRLARPSRCPDPRT